MDVQNATDIALHKIEDILLEWEYSDVPVGDCAARLLACIADEILAAVQAHARH